MDKDRINRWLTLTANFGVIVSLLFLAYEINQSTKATIAAASQGLTDQSITYFEAQLDPGVISQAVYKQRQDDELFCSTNAVSTRKGNGSDTGESLPATWPIIPAQFKCGKEPKVAGQTNSLQK